MEVKYIFSDNALSLIEKVLKFYADEDLYDYEISYDMAYLIGGDILSDMGNVARNALDKKDGKEYLKALEFYADEDLYDYDLSYDMAELLYGDILDDNGSKAAEVLDYIKNNLTSVDKFYGCC